MVTHTILPSVPAVAFLVEQGVQPWEDIPRFPMPPRELTLTLIAREAEELPGPIESMLKAAQKSHPGLLRWSTAGVPFVANRLQARRLRAVLSTPLPGFGETYLDAPAPGEAVCVASVLTRPFAAWHLEAFLQYRYTLLLIARDAALGPREVCERLRRYHEKLDGTAIRSMLANAPGAVYARFYLDDHPPHAVQFYGLTEDIHILVGSLRAQQLTQLRSRDEAVPHWLVS